MFQVLLDSYSYYGMVNQIDWWADPHNAMGETANEVIDSNDEPPANNQQREMSRGY